MAGVTGINTTGAQIQFGTVSAGAFTNNANVSIIGSTSTDVLTITAGGGLTLAAAVQVNGALTATGAVTGANHVGPGTGLTGTAAGLSIGGNAATASIAAACSGQASYATSLYVNGDYSDDAGVRRIPWMDIQSGVAGVRSMYTTASLGYAPSTGTLSATKIVNAVWNDIADYLEVESDTEIEFGKAYVYVEGKHRKSGTYAEKGVLGIASDTLGFGVGQKPEGTPQIPIAIGGFVLAYVDQLYDSGTPLTCTKDGWLTEMGMGVKMEYPERMVGTFYKIEPAEFWNYIEVKGRSWVKIR